MKYNEHMSWTTCLLVCVLVGLTHEARETSPRSLTMLAENLSDMWTFKNIDLKPFNRVRQPGELGHEKVQKHIKKTLLDLNWDIQEDKFTAQTPFGEKNFNNIIATFNPGAPERLVLAAHYDSKYFSNFEFIGATDSAVPCAILLHIARTLNCVFLHDPEEEWAKNMTVQMLFLDGEEAFVQWTSTDSIYGARHLAEKWSQMADPLNTDRKYIDGIKHFVLLDLIGTSDTRFGDIVPETSDLYNQFVKIEKKLAKGGLLKRQVRAKLFPQTRSIRAGIQDDHVPFQQRGVPILHLISYPFPTVWHKKSDNFKSLDYDLIDDFLRIFRVFVTDYLQKSVMDSTCRKDEL